MNRPLPSLGGLRAQARQFLPAPAPYRHQLPMTPRKRALGEVFGLWALVFGVPVLNAVLLLTGDLPQQQGAPTVGGELQEAGRRFALIGVAVWLAVLLTRARSVPLAALGLRPPWAWHEVYRRQALGVAAFMFCGGLIADKIFQFLDADAAYPFSERGPANLISVPAAAMGAGVVEELVLVGFLVVTLEQARTPTWLIYAIGLGLRLSFHVYYGPLSPLWIALWGSLALWLFRRTRRLTPLIVVHAGKDLLGMLGAGDPWQRLVLDLIIIVGLLAGVLWGVTDIVRSIRRGRGRASLSSAR